MLNFSNIIPDNTRENTIKLSFISPNRSKFPRDSGDGFVNSKGILMIQTSLVGTVSVFKFGDYGDEIYLSGDPHHRDFHPKIICCPKVMKTPRNMPTGPETTSQRSPRLLWDPYGVYHHFSDFVVESASDLHVDVGTTILDFIEEIFFLRK